MDYRRATEIANRMLSKDGDDPDALTLLSRIQVGTGKIDQAQQTYSYIYQHKKMAAGMRAEAAMVLGRLPEALALLQKTLKEDPQQPELLFIAALIEYQLGHIQRVEDYMLAALESGLDWNDEDPITLVVEHCLTGPEYLDLEHIYLDCQDQLFEGKSGSKNRWFSLNMSIYELYTASTPAKRNKIATDLLHLLDGPKDLTPASGKAKLHAILTDFSHNEQDARFGLEGLKLLEAGRYDELARMVLALQLEHLKEFSSVVDIHLDQMDSSSMQTLTTKLPMRMAIGLLTLYAMATSEDRKFQLMEQEIEADLSAALITACFSAFYQEINMYKKRQQPQPGKMKKQLRR